MAAPGGRPKLTRGRQKIEIKRIEDEADRLIAFTKRKSGIYKKASIISAHCGAEVALIVLSLAGKVLSSAHPTLESVTGKVLDQISPLPSNSTHPIVEAKRRIRINELNQQSNQIIVLLDDEKEREKSLQKMKDLRGKSHGWWDAPIEELDLKELKQMDESLARLYENVKVLLKERDVPEAAPGSYSPSSSSLMAKNCGPGN